MFNKFFNLIQAYQRDQLHAGKIEIVFALNPVLDVLGVFAGRWSVTDAIENMIGTIDDIKNNPMIIHVDGYRAIFGDAATDKMLDNL